METPVVTLTIDEQIAAQPAIIEAARLAYRKLSADESAPDEDVEKARSAWKAEQAKLTKLEGDKKAEEAAAKLAEARNAAIKLRVDYRAAVLANEAVQNDKKATIEQKQAASELEKAAETALDNRILPVHVSTPRAAKTADGTGTVKTGSKAQMYRDAANKWFDEGKTGAEVRALAKELPEYNDGTANAEIVKVEKARGLR